MCDMLGRRSHWNTSQFIHRELDDLSVDREHIGGRIMWGQELGACGRIFQYVKTHTLVSLYYFQDCVRTEMSHMHAILVQSQFNEIDNSRLGRIDHEVM